MGLFNKTERKFAQTVSDLSFANPFLHERVEFEKAALGQDFDAETRPFWSWSLCDEADRPNVITLTRRVADLAKELRKRIVDGIEVTDSEFDLYDDIAHYVIYYSTISLQAGTTSSPPAETANWEKFSEAFDNWMCIEGSSEPGNDAATRKAPSFDKKVHVYCYLSQLQRAFHNIFHCVIGRSWPIAKLRARIWQSIFTHNLRRYRNSLFDKMNEVMIHNDYIPQAKRNAADRAESLAEDIRSLKLTAEDLLGRYCDLAFQKTNSYEKAAAILEIDRRTVKAKISASNDK